MVGNDPSVKGGITSVISQLLSHNWQADHIEMRFIPTYIDAGSIKKALFYARAYSRIRQEIRVNRPDVVHIHMSYKGSFVRKYAVHRLCQRYGIPDIIHLHGSEFQKWYDESDISTKERIRTLLRECSAFITLGDKWDQAVRAIEPQTNTVVVSNTVLIPREKAHWSPEMFQVLFLGVLIKRKGVSDLLQSVKILRKQNKTEHLRIVIAGTGAEENALKEQAAQLEINDLVDFVGWTDGNKKAQLLRDSQMLVLPSYNEGLPIAILEAISYGLPVVATDVGDIASAVHDGENGYLIQPGDVDALAAGIAKVSDNRGEYEQLSARSAAIARENFSDEPYFAQIKQCYQMVGMHRS